MVLDKTDAFVRFNVQTILLGLSLNYFMWISHQLYASLQMLSYQLVKYMSAVTKVE